MFSFFFFKQKTAYEMRISDWSSDVCSSDLLAAFENRLQRGAAARYAALHRADRAAADRRAFLIGQLPRADQHERLALVDGQHQQRALHVGKVQAVVLIVGRDEQPLGRQPVIIGGEFLADRKSTRLTSSH